jgi:CHAT domain-containing protein
MLLEALRKRDIFKEAGIPFGKQQKHQMLQQELTFLQSRLEEESSKEPADDKILQAIHQKIQATEKELSKLQEELHGKYPYYAATQQRSDTLLLEDIETFSAHTKSTIVEYFWGEKALYALSTYAGKSALIRIPSSDTVQQHINTFRQCLNNGYRVESANQDYRSFSESAYAIYQHLLKPVLTRLGVSVKDAAGKSSLIVIPDGPLMHIPFEALTSQPVQSELADYRKLDYLLKHFTLSYTYSAGLLLKSYPGNSHKQANVLAISFSKEDILASNSGDIQLLRTNLNHELPGSAKELRAISSYMNGKFYIGEQATEGVFKKEVPRYDILHLAIHGEGNKEQTYSSRLIFKRETDSVNDGFLYSYELYNIPMQAKLAVLSACETGLGKSTPGEGIFSMARGFLYAGCSAVVMSYWQVNDQTTAQLMEYLYKNLYLGINIDQALGKAKLEYLTKADRRNAHPSNWAAFVAMGDMKPVMKAPDQLPFLAIGSSILTIFIMLLLLYLYRKKTKQVGNQEAI